LESVRLLAALDGEDHISGGYFGVGDELLGLALSAFELIVIDVAVQRQFDEFLGLRHDRCGLELRL
jgi:hypothetical protein